MQTWPLYKWHMFQYESLPKQEWCLRNWSCPCRWTQSVAHSQCRNRHCLMYFWQQISGLQLRLSYKKFIIYLRLMRQPSFNRNPRYLRIRSIYIVRKTKSRVSFCLLKYLTGVFCKSFCLMFCKYHSVLPDHLLSRRLGYSSPDYQPFLHIFSNGLKQFGEPHCTGKLSLDVDTVLLPTEHCAKNATFLILGKDDSLHQTLWGASQINAIPDPQQCAQESQALIFSVM